MAHLLNAAAAATPLVAPAIKTFAAKYSAAPHEPVTLQRQLALFDVNDATVLRVTPTEARNRLFALTGEAKPCALLTLEMDPTNPTGVVKIHHAPAQCPHLIDSPPHPYMGRNFVAYGDLFNKETANFEFPNDATNLANMGLPTYCYNHVAIDAALAADPGATIFGPFAITEPDTSAVIVRNTCLLPARYAARFLSRSFTPKEAWEQIGGAIRADDAAVVTACAPVLHWLQYVLHKSNALHAASPCILPAFLAQVGMPLREHRCKVNYGYMPALDDSAIITREAELIATRIGDVRDQLQLQLEEGRRLAETSKAKKTPCTKWPERIQHILNLAQVEVEEDLPPFWHRLANARDKDTRVLVEGLFAVACTSLPAVSNRMKTVVEPALASTLVSADWRMINPDQLDSGVNPWVVGQASSEASVRASTANMIYDHATNGGAQLTLADVTSLTKLMIKDKVPVVHSDAMRMIKQLYICYGSAWGNNHPIVEELGDFIDEYQQAIEEFLGEMSYAPQLPTYTKAMVPCLVVRYVQVHIANWTDKQWNSTEALAPPQLASLFEKMKLRIQWEIPMPARYEEFLVGFGMPAATPGGRLRSGRDDRSAVPPPGPGAPPPGPNSTIVNAGYKASLFDQYRNKRDASGNRIKARVARANSNNVTPRDFCPAYHICGQCNVACSKCADHVSHTDEQDAELVAWAEVHWHEAQ